MGIISDRVDKLYKEAVDNTPILEKAALEMQEVLQAVEQFLLTPAGKAALGALMGGTVGAGASALAGQSPWAGAIGGGMGGAGLGYAGRDLPGLDELIGNIAQ